MLTLRDIELAQGGFTLEANFSVQAKKITAVVGPSGGGKSTLISAIAGFLKPTSGSMFWHDTDITALSPSDRPVSILFQDNNLFPHLTIADNIGLALRPNLRLSADDSARIAQALADVGLDGLGARKPSALSGGQQSRAALARILLADRDIVLLDEPFAALGPGLKAEMLELVRAKVGLFAGHHLWFCCPHQEGCDIFRHVVHIICMSIGKLNDTVRKRRRHSDPATGYRVVTVVLTLFRVTAGCESGIIKAFKIVWCAVWSLGIAVHQGRDILGPAHALEQLGQACAVWSVEARARFGHQAKVRRIRQRRARELVGWCGWAEVAFAIKQRLVEHFVEFGISTCLIFRQRWAAFVVQIAEGNQFKTVTRGANLGVDLQTALQLVLIERAKRAFEREVEVFDKHFGFCGERCACCHSKCCCCGEGEFARPAARTTI